MSRPLLACRSLALPRISSLALAVCSLCHSAAQAQEPTTTLQPTSRLVPSVSVSESYLHSSNGANGANGTGGGEFITRVSPGLSWTSRSGRVQGTVNYVMDASAYSRRGNGADITNSLAANVKTTLIDQRAYVDVLANVGQTSISAYGRQSGNDTFQVNANRTEFSNLQVSPYVLGSLGGFADYAVRVSGAANAARGFSASNTTNWSALASLRSPGTQRLIGWGLSAQSLHTEYQTGRGITTERGVAELNVKPWSDLLLFATAGEERTNALDLNGRSYSTVGGGLRWVPSVRTSVSLEGEKRYFGNSHRIVLEHRTPQTVWRYVDSRNSSDGAGITALTPQITLFDLYFAQFASTVPDPIQREALIRDVFRSQNLNAVVGGGTLVSALTVQRRQELGAAWIGRRTSVNLQVFALDVRPIENAAAAAPVLAQSRVRQTGVTASVAYRLTPQMSANVIASRQVTASSGLLSGNRLHTVGLGLTTQVSRQASFGFNARYADFSSSTQPYREALATATLSYRF